MSMKVYNSDRSFLFRKFISPKVFFPMGQSSEKKIRVINPNTILSERTFLWKEKGSLFRKTIIPIVFYEWHLILKAISECRSFGIETIRGNNWSDKQPFGVKRCRIFGIYYIGDHVFILNLFQSFTIYLPLFMSFKLIKMP